MNKKTEATPKFSICRQKQTPPRTSCSKLKECV